MMKIPGRHLYGTVNSRVLELISQAFKIGDGGYKAHALYQKGLHLGYRVRPTCLADRFTDSSAHGRRKRTVSKSKEELWKPECLRAWLSAGPSQKPQNNE